MVNNSTNINKSYNQPQVIEHKQNSRNLQIKIHALSWERHKNVAELRLLVCSKHLIMTYMYPTAIHILRNKRSAKIRFHTINTTYYYKNE
jgi:hypothetical protein